MESAASAPLGRSGVFQPPASSVLPLDFGRLRAQVATYLRPEDVGRIEAAYHFAADAHSGQFRISGDPYISHPVAVAEILAGWHLDAQALCAALLHDVMEDTHITKSEIAERFGRTTAELVDGVSKLDKIEFQSQEEAQAENFRKMLLAMASDLRVILIKLADRLHNMRTLDCVRPDKRRRIARETQEIHAPIANRLGLNALYRELQELAFKHVHPMRFRVLSKAILAARGNRREVVGKILAAIEERLPQWNIQAEVRGREKHLYSIYRKMNEKRLSFSQVLDIYGFRVIVPDVQTCYRALGALHGLYKPVPGKFKDYIAIPKANGYQSLHTTLIGPFGTPLEVQIRTAQMNHVADSGVASHWLYKEDEKTLTDLQAKTHTWLQSLLELQSTSGDSSEFLEHVKVDLFPGEVYAFTPKGKIFALPRGATVVDFAYAVHTDVGNRCVAGRVNGELLPLRTELRNGDQVEIITAAHASPNPAWLSYVRTGKARAQIRHFLKNAHQEEAFFTLGERLLNQALRPHGLTLGSVSAIAWERYLREFTLANRKELMTDIGLGRRLSAIVARRLAEIQDIESGRADVVKPKPAGAILIRGTEGVAVQLARCCRPIPGDPIVGIIRKGQGLEVHMHDCPQARKLRGERERWIDVEWEPGVDRLFDVTLRLLTHNVRGVLAKVANAIAEQDCNIQNVSTDGEQGAFSTIYLTVQVTHRLHLAKVIRGVRNIPEVVRIGRLKGDPKLPVA
ncbi:MAG TPA: bifunctional (p)ppGpp synthetase/guanosine-3',5'-bis(diphosphate) 3'-pyrophosphohydrolase [Zoogloea sp.]|uniref:RelA/SpoT family protein n=1 Tax=Zoogloea sp. TaxID=49181 RepID=UPI002D17D04A|nr:bifunctional (p)ppGpp synthetase/guanosine-3',5'-bis(diphosphate) 3'-pyrophosphohydrolase [Zoogloea sp.]HMV16576.1 bifunctional (p)ppGpp synthetase/guanosine-3',5'-bis(diphosphate) 3'-pyrophosphohydrolase [Rhodocyclaceae bacterium]HMV62015.1 bifunctional (p)ppGpp synthetase/guanosine-3',5'-bis(diphosphate) 3'-pyrophosphohydrolase [Rhodocyclaceae bacterium]HMW51188.1 bifunctional (p)ppGpp synthetase/guanosine-3',5'-bis(diphosphate) 3'-pyrophosphohydrolase [Rhodocyclaceae bacterium]HMY48726.1 